MYKLIGGGGAWGGSKNRSLGQTQQLYGTRKHAMVEYVKNIRNDALTL